MSAGKRIVLQGEIQGSATVAVLPTITVPLSVRFRALSTNNGNVYLGILAGTTKPDGTTDATSGWELDAGQEIELQVANLNELYRICDNAGDDLVYLIFG